MDIIARWLQMNLLNLQKVTNELTVLTDAQ